MGCRVGLARKKGINVGAYCAKIDGAVLGFKYFLMFLQKLQMLWIPRAVYQLAPGCRVAHAQSLGQPIVFPAIAPRHDLITDTETSGSHSGPAPLAPTTGFACAP